MPLADLIPNGDPEVTGYIVLMAFGFLVGIAGHMTKTNWLVGTGIGLIFVAVVLWPLLTQGG